MKIFLFYKETMKYLRCFTENKTKTLFLFFATVFLLVLPDVIFSLIHDFFKVSRDWKAALLLAPLSFGLITSKSNIFSLFVLFFLASLQIAQFIHLAYFGTLLSPFALHFLRQEIHDVVSEGLHIWKSYFYIFPMVLLPFFAIYFINRRFSHVKSWLGVAFVLGTFSYFGYNLLRNPAIKFTPNPRRITLDNSLKAFWGYFIIQYRNYQVHSYKPYSVTENDKFQRSGPINIIYIIGESSNYGHMSLFGYSENDTTPNLKDLSKNDNFIFKKGISSSNCTYSSCKFLVNIIREPDNLKQSSLDETNLFKLAKLSGFKTFYFSSQSDHLLSSIGGTNYIDVISVRETDPISFQIYKDLHLLDLIKNQTYTDKNFIVIHQSSVHSPYNLTYGEGYKPKVVFNNHSEQILNDYDNAMLYNDMLISSIFNHFNNSKAPFLIVWTSDHNELLGENGLFGHGSGLLVPECANVPFIIQSNDKAFLEKAKNIFSITHYEMAKLIAENIGFDIKNANEEQNTFYINGIDPSGTLGYIRLQKDIDKLEVIYDPVTNQ